MVFVIGIDIFVVQFVDFVMISMMQSLRFL